ncbi:MAG: hypothetical protein ACFCUN_04800 [Hyphomicrobiaceae bacterium]
MSLERQFRRSGVAIVEHALDPDTDLATMDRAFRRQPRSVVRMPFSDGAESGRLGSPTLQIGADFADWLETHPALLCLATRLLAAPARLVRIAPAEDVQREHWIAPWRQSKTIAVASRHRVTGFRAWVERDGHALVEPPVWVLQQSVILQVYLDDCRAFDGPLEVLEGSHLDGRLKRVEIAERARTLRSMTCLCDRSDILALSPLAVHRRHRSNGTTRQRVLKLMFSAASLPPPLEWASLTPDIDQAIEIWQDGSTVD